MTSCVRIISTSSMDSSPSILLISSDNTKMLFNCGEGCQRTFVEYGQRLSTVSTICVCSLHHSMVGGLPGTILTTADTAAATLNNINANNRTDTRVPSSSSINRQERSEDGELESDAIKKAAQLQIIGPRGIQKYILSLRHFMQRKNYSYQIDEVYPQSVYQEQQPIIFQPIAGTTNRQCKQQTKTDNERKKKNADKNSNQPDLGFTIECIAFYDHLFVDKPANTRKRSYDGERTTNPTISDEETALPPPPPPPPATTTTTTRSEVISENVDISNFRQRHLCVSFILKTPPIPGKFLTDKAIALGIPKGPLYGQLKAGKDVSYTDTMTNEVKFVSSKDVVEPSSPPIVILILYYPSAYVAQQLFQSHCLRRKEQSLDHTDKIENSNSNCNADDATGVDPELVVHITTERLFHQYGMHHWKNNSREKNTTDNIDNSDKKSRQKTDHIFLPIYDSTSGSSTTQNDSTGDNNTNQSPFHSAFEDAYKRSLICPDIYYNPIQCSPLSSLPPSTSFPDNFRIGQATMEYTILPLSKRGFKDIDNEGISDASVQHDNFTNQTSSDKVDAIILSKQIINANNASCKQPSNCGFSLQGELIFTGTASAVPCKHRNVTGMLLKQSDGRSILLDVGEGTIGQLCRMRLHPHEVFNEIKAVWISHPHADHHLGLMRLLKERTSNDKVLLIAPKPIFRFLREMEEIDSDIRGSYIPIDCMDLLGETTEFWNHQQVIQNVLGVSKCCAVPVAHCAYSYAVILEGTCFGTVAYSGDCRPSKQLAMAAKGADLLIHESTFENGMEADAVLKNHSTIEEAIKVGQQMECKCIVLTHFSQRYAKIPPSPLKNVEDYPFPIIFAYDFMMLQPHTLVLSSKLTPALRLLFVDENDVDDYTTSIPTQLLSIPGVFADARLL